MPCLWSRFYTVLIVYPNIYSDQIYLPQRKTHSGTIFCQMNIQSFHLTTLFIGEDLPWQPWHQHLRLPTLVLLRVLAASRRKSDSSARASARSFHLGRWFQTFQTIPKIAQSIWIIPNRLEKWKPPTSIKLCFKRS